jgi:hypothetical protein
MRRTELAHGIDNPAGRLPRIHRPRASARRIRLTRRGRRVVVAALAALGVVLAVLAVRALSSPADWDTVAGTMSRTIGPRAVVLDGSASGLAGHLKDAKPMPKGGAAVREIDLVSVGASGLPTYARGKDPLPLPTPGFDPVARSEAGGAEVVRYRVAEGAERITPAALAGEMPGGATVLLVP